MPKQAFEYFEIRPCISYPDDSKHGLGTDSFTSEADWSQAVAVAKAKNAGVGVFWTIFGRYIDEQGQLLSLAIGDFAEKEDAFTVMDAILAPIAAARDAIDEAKHAFNLDDIGSRRAFLTAIADVGDDLTDFIAQSSDRERL